MSRGALRLCAAVLTCVLVWNLATPWPRLRAATAVLAPPLKLLRLDQQWAGYLPHGPAQRGWIAAAGETVGGRHVGVLHAPLPVQVPSPTRFAHYQGSIRWHRWNDAVLHSDIAALRYAQYLCHGWNTRHTRADALQSLSLAYVTVHAAGPASRTAPGSDLEQRPLWDGACGAAAAQASSPSTAAQQHLP